MFSGNSEEDRLEENILFKYLRREKEEGYLALVYYRARGEGPCCLEVEDCVLSFISDRRRHIHVNVRDTRSTGVTMSTTC